MRVTSAFKQLLGLEGVKVCDVVFGATAVVVQIALRRQKLHCPECRYRTRAREDTRPVDSVWRHLDLGVWRLEIRARLRRINCPVHGVRVEGVPFARSVTSGFTRDFEDLVAWLATRTDKTAVSRLVRIAWRTVGDICSRVCATELDPGRLDGLFEIGIDEVSWRKHHKYLTLVSDHQTGKIVWGAPGRDAATVDGFFTELGQSRAAQLEAVSMDMSGPFTKAVSDPVNAPQAVICYDPFHVVALATKALDQVRRDVWNELRAEDADKARQFKGARWVLLKNPDGLNHDQQTMLRKLRRRGGAAWRAYTLKEALREIFHHDLTPDEAEQLLERFCSKASRSGLAPFVRLARTIRRHQTGIMAAIRRGISNARAESLNNRVRLIIRRAHGFHSPEAALALTMLTLGPITLKLPHEKPASNKN